MVICNLFEKHNPRIELFLVLPEYWNFYDTEAVNQFPIKMLTRLVELITKDNLVIEEGYHILADDEKYKDIIWPDYLAGLYASDIPWGQDNKQEENQKEKEVTLFTLVPIKKTKSGYSKQDLEKNRKSKWGKLTLKIGDEK